MLVLRLAPNPLHHGAVAIARSLGRMGARVYAVVEDGSTPLARSRYCAGTVRLPLPPADALEAVRLLTDFAETIGERPLLIPIDDVGAVFVADHAQALTAAYVFPQQPDGLARRLSSKLEMQRICIEQGIPTPAIRVPGNDEEVAAAAADLRYPVMVKRITEWAPAEQHGPRMGRATTPDELVARFAEMRDRDAPNLLFQEYVPGGVDWMFNGYFDAASRCLFAATGFKVRQYPVGTGPTSLGECRHNDGVRACATDLLTRVGYRGIVDAGMRFDPRDGEYKVLDVNPRIGSTFRLFTGRGGIDVARALYLDFAGEPVESDEPADGRRWLVENYDLAAAAGYARSGRLSATQWIRSLRGVREVAWTARDDLGPARSAAAASVRSALRRVLATTRTGKGVRR